jgi:hypothetical protein
MTTNVNENGGNFSIVGEFPLKGSHEGFADNIPPRIDGESFSLVARNDQTFHFLLSHSKASPTPRFSPFFSLST